MTVQFITEICAPSNTFTVRVKDSCYSTKVTQVISAPIYTVMQEPQKGSEQIFLQQEMGIWGWPWTDTLSLQLNEPNKCGFIVYSIRYVDGSA